MEVEEKASLMNEKDKATFGIQKSRIKFEIYAIEKNPKLQLLAIASRIGEVVVKRVQWKTAWKRNFSKENFLKRAEAFLSSSYSSTEPSTSKDKDLLESLRWSPDGQVLLVAFQSGRIFFLDVQTGRPVYFKKLEYQPKLVRWIQVFPCSILKHLMKQFDTPLSTISSANFSFSDNSPKDSANLIADLEPLSRQIFHNSLIGTLLCISCENEETAFIDLFASGILFILRINVRQWLLNQCKIPVQLDASSVQITDVTLNAEKDSRKLQISVKYCTYGRPIFLSGLENQCTPANSESQAVCNLTAFEVSNLDFGELFGVFSTIAHCCNQILFITIYINEMLQFCTYNWKTTSELFHQRLFLQSNSNEYAMFDHCRDLFLILSSGFVTPLLREFFERDPALMRKELKLANNFVDNYFTVFLNGIHTGLQPALDALLYYTLLLNSHLSKLETLSQYDWILSLSNTLQKTSHNDFGPLSKSAFQPFMDNLKISINGLSQNILHSSTIAEENRKELKHFLRWLSVTARQINNDGNVKLDELIDLALIRELLSSTLRKFLTDLNGRGNGSEELIDLLDMMKENLPIEKENNICFLLDRVLPLIDYEGAITSSTIPHIPTAAEYLFKLVRELNRDGITNFFSFPISLRTLTNRFNADD